MARTTVVNLKKSDYDVYVGRSGAGKDGYFGNPYILETDTVRQRKFILALYRDYFYKRIANDPIFKERVLSLRGKRLGCFCIPKHCHASVIADYLNSLESSS